MLLKRSKFPTYAKERNKTGDSRIVTYINDRIIELKKLANSKKKDNRNPRVFFEATAFIDFLVSHINNNESSGQLFKKFIKEYIYPNDIILKIRNDTYSLSNQLWDILRCGGLHNYSLCPYGWYNHSGFKHSLILTNLHGSKKSKLTHKLIVDIDLNDNSKKNSKAIVLVAEEFINDIEIGTNKLLKEFKSKKPEFNSLKSKLRQSFKDCPPIGWYGYTII